MAGNIAHQYEKRLCMENKAAKDGVTFEEAREMENARERNEQKEHRRKRIRIQIAQSIMLFPLSMKRLVDVSFALLKCFQNLIFIYRIC